MHRKQVVGRTLNRRLVFVLIIVGIVSAGALFGLHKLQVRRSGNVFLKAAEKAVSEGNQQQALRNFGLYLRLEPNDSSIRSRLGELQTQLGNDEGAYWTLEHALRANPNEDESRRLLVEVAMRIQRYADARDHLDQLLVNGSTAELLDLRGQCQEHDVDPASAEEYYRQAIKLDPRQTETYRRLADLLRNQLDRSDQANECLELLVDSNPDMPQAYVIRGRALLRAGSIDKASQDAARALELVPSDDDGLLLSSGLLFSAECALQRGDLEVALEQAKRGVQAAPQIPDWYLVLANVSMQKGEVEQAHEWLRQGTRNASQMHDVLASNLANSLLDEGKVEEAAEVIEVLRADETAHVPLLAYLDGRVAFERGQWLSSMRTLQQVRPEFLSDTDVLKQIDFWLGQCHGQLGSADLQLTAFRRAVEIDPFWALARQGVVTALTAAGQTDEALSELRQLMQLKNAPVEGWLELTRLSILQQLQRNSDDVDWITVGKQLDYCDKKLPNRPIVAVLRAEVMVAQGKAQEAVELLRGRLEDDPQQAELWIALIDLRLRKEDSESVNTTLEDARTQLGDAVPIRLAEARYLLKQSSATKDETIRALADKVDHFTPSEVAQLWRGLTAIAWQRQDWEHAQQLLTHLAERQPNDLQLWLLQFDLALKREDAEGMERILAKVAEIEGPGPLWHYGSAVHLRLQAEDANSPELNQALQHLGQARSARPSWSRLAVMAAEIQQLQGDDRAALDQLTRAIELGARDTRIIRQTAQMLYAQRLYRQADRIIRLVERRKTPFSSELGRLASQVSIQLEEFDRALDVARRTASRSNDYQDHIWLGQLAGLVANQTQGFDASSLQNLRDEAEAAFRAAIALAEDVPDTWVALVRFLGQHDDLQAARDEIRKAEEKIDPNLAPLALAYCYEQINDVKEAEARYLAAVDSDSDDNVALRQVCEFYLRSDQLNPARDYLVKLKDSDLVDRRDVEWARRRLALVELSLGSYENLGEATRLINRNLSESPDSVPDLRVRALILAAQRSANDRLEAIKTWDKVFKLDPSPAVEDRLRLAALHEANDNWAAAARQFRAVMTSEDMDDRYEEFLATYISALLRNDEIHEAETWWFRLQNRAPTGWAATSLQAEILAREDRHDEAQRLLVNWLAELKSPDSSDILASWAPVVAARLEGLASIAGKGDQADGYLAQAGQMLLQYADADQGSALAAFLVRHDRIDDALAEAESRSMAKQNPEGCLSFVEAMVRSGQAQAQHRRKAKRLLVAIHKQRGRSVPVLLTLAKLQMIDHQLASAESIYRETLRDDPDNVIALNNLAVVLAAQKKELAEAGRLVEQAMRTAGRRAPLLDTQAIVMIAGGDYSNALRQLQAALESQDDPSFYLHQAFAFLKSGQHQEAQLALEQAEDLGLQPDMIFPFERDMHRQLLAARRR